MTGVYRITINDMHYVGSSINIEKRIASHKFYLQANRHVNRRLQNLYNKYKTFDWCILELSDVENLTIVEQKHIDTYLATGKCANLNVIATRFSYWNTLTPEEKAEQVRKCNATKKKNGYKGGWYYVRQRIFYTRKGIPHTPETKAKMSQRKLEFLLKHPTFYNERLSKGRIKRWSSRHKFVICSDIVCYGPYINQKDALKDVPISNVSMCRLYQGTRAQVKGFTISFLI